MGGQVIEEFKASKRFAEAEGQQEMLKDEDLKAFAQRFSDVKGVVDGFDIDEDDVVATESLGALNDPFTQAGALCHLLPSHSCLSHR